MTLALCLWLAAAPAGQPWPQLKQAIERYLGRPYSWGATGLKSFDCSGFVWRVLYDEGILLKRTTARKLYVCLPPVEEADRWTPGNLVFFDLLRHVGIVSGRDSFYHAESRLGTTQSRFEPYWHPRVWGMRRIPPRRD